MAGQHRKSTSGFELDHDSHNRRSKTIFTSNFDKIFQPAANMLGPILLPVSENKPPPYWNSTFGFSLWRFRGHRYVILRRRTKFYLNWTIGNTVMTS